MLTPVEVAFLLSQRISEDQVFDGRNMSAAERSAAARASGYWLVLTDSPCRNSGHRLKTTSGHCVQCNTAVIAYNQRNHESGYVYIAASSLTRLLKVGCTRNIEHRASMLNNHRYGGATDWIVIATRKTDNMGQVEFQIHSDLANLLVRAQYPKDGRWQESREVFEGRLQIVWDSFSRNTEHVPQSDRKKIRNISRFDFS